LVRSFAAFQTAVAVPNQSVVFAEKVETLIRGIANAQIPDGHPAFDKESFGESNAFIATCDFSTTAMDDR
jgi:hypothetical protein